MKKITVILASLILTAFSCFAQEVPDTDFFSLNEGAGFRLGFTDFGFDYQEWLNENNGISLCIGAMGDFYGSTTISITGTYYHSFMNAVVPGGKFDSFRSNWSWKQFLSSCKIYNKFYIRKSNWKNFNSC